MSRRFVVPSTIRIVVLLAGAAIQCTAGASEELMSSGGCISCHRVDQKLIGPAFKEVAARYRKDPLAAARLFAKVREGGEGVWGDVPMQPNPEEKISDAELRSLLDWLLQLQ